MSDGSRVVALADTVSELLYGIAGWSLVLLALMIAVAGGRVLAESGLTTAGAVGATILFGLAFVTAAFGIFVNPRFRRRLERRHDPTAFGRVHSVDQRVVRPEEECHERCVSCQDRVESGLVRRYREEYAIAGIPVYTSSAGYNHYCLACASAEFLGEEVDRVEESDDGDRARVTESGDGDRDRTEEPSDDPRDRAVERSET